MSLFLKTKLCKYHLVGMCTRGNACKFAHGEEDLAAAPDFSKTEMCAGFLHKGACAHGGACKFAHSKEELRPRLVDRLLEAAQGQPPRLQSQPEDVQPQPQQRLRPRPSAEPMPMSPPPSLGVSSFGLEQEGAKGEAFNLAEVEAMSRASTEDLDDFCPQPGDGAQSRQCSSTSASSWGSAEFSEGPVGGPPTTIQAPEASDPFLKMINAFDTTRGSSSFLMQRAFKKKDVDSEVEEDSSHDIYANVRVKNTFLDWEEEDSAVDFRAVKSSPALPLLA